MTSVADPEHFHMDPDPELDPAFRDDTDPDFGSCILAFLSILEKILIILYPARYRISGFCIVKQCCGSGSVFYATYQNFDRK